MSYSQRNLLTPALRQAYKELSDDLKKIKSPNEKCYHGNNYCSVVSSIGAFSNNYTPSYSGSESGASDNGFSGFPGSALR